MTVSAGLPQGPSVPGWVPPATYLDRLTAVEGLRNGSSAFSLISVAPSSTLTSGNIIDIEDTTPAQTGWAGKLKRSIFSNVWVLSTDPATPVDVTYQGIYSAVNYGRVGGAGDVAAVGSAIAMSTGFIVHNSGNASNEYAAHFGYIRNEATATPGRNWFTDWGCYSAIGVQQSLHSGINLGVVNHYNGSPSSAEADGIALFTGTRLGPGITSATPHWTAQNYPVDNGLHILGGSGPAGSAITGAGFKRAIKLGRSGTGWSIASSWFQTGLEVNDFDTFGILVQNRRPEAAAGTPAIAVDAGNGPVVIGATAPADTANLLYIKAPTGTTDPVARIHGAASTDSWSMQIGNGSGTVKLFSAGSADTFITGTVAGDTGIRVGTAGKKFVIGSGSGMVLKIGVGADLGFFGATAVTQRTGWGSPTGTATRTTFDTSTITLPQLAERVRGLIDDLKSYGLLGA